MGRVREREGTSEKEGERGIESVSEKERKRGREEGRKVLSSCSGVHPITKAQSHTNLSPSHLIPNLDQYDSQQWI